MLIFQSNTISELQEFLLTRALPRQALALVLLCLIAWAVRHLSWPIARRIVRLTRYASRERDNRPARRLTLQGLIADIVSFAAAVPPMLFAAMVIAKIDADTLLWTIGLFSAAFGLGARPLISDFLAGISIVFEDLFTVGEKIQFDDIEGVIEGVNLRTTMVRAPSGELCVVPNGEIRIMRNYSRGLFSATDVTVSIKGEDLSKAIPLLEDLGEIMHREIDELMEPWQVISRSGRLGVQADLTLLAKARYGHGADLRPRLLARVQSCLAKSGIETV